MIKRENLSDWVDLYLDRALSDADAKNLLDCFVNDPKAKEFFVEEVVFSALCHGMNTNFDEEVTEVMETIRLGAAAPDITALVMKDLRSPRNELDDADWNSRLKEVPRKRPANWAVGYGIAACFAVFSFVFISFQSRETYATFSQLDGAEWGGRYSELSVGDPIGNEHLELLSGYAVLKFGDGVQVSVEGPAYFSAVSSTQLKLDCGDVTAQVEPSGIGFQVITEHGTVTDLGTRFEVSVERGKSTDVGVLDGVVVFKPAEVEKEHQLLAGHGIRVKDDDSEITLFEISRKNRKNRRLEMLSGVQGKGGEIRIVSAREIMAAESLKTYQSLAVFPEKRRVAAKGATSVNIWMPGSFSAELLNDVAEKRDLGDSTVDSFLVQFNPPTVEKGKGVEPFRFIGGIEFDRPIVGIMTNAEEILGSHAEYGSSQVNYEQQVKGELEFKDQVSLSEDRRTLTFDWVVTPLFEQSRDQIRVLVESENNNVN